MICLIGIIMIYPLIWMIMSSFKETGTIFTTAGSLIPEKFILDNYRNGWKGFAGIAGFEFRGRKLMFTAMLLSMMLPAQVLMIPQYLWYQKLNWVGSYMPLIIPYFFATQGFFVYLMSNFIEGIPRELDEAAKIDGCSSDYGAMFAMATLSVLPAVVIFLFFQKYLVEGISTSGLKG